MGLHWCAFLWNPRISCKSCWHRSPVLGIFTWLWLSEPWSFFLSLEMLFLLFVVLVVLFVFVVVCLHSSRKLFTFCVVLPLRPMVSSASMPARTPRMTGWPMSLLSSNGSSIHSILSLMCFLDSEM